MVSRFMVLLAALLAWSGLQARPFDVDDLVRLDRVSDPQLRPDGKAVVYTLRETDWDSNKARRSLWLLPLERANAQPRRLTAPGSNAEGAQFSADGRRLYFLSSRGGSSQVWLLEGEGEARAVTQLPVDVSGFRLAPDGRQLVVAADVFIECGADLDCTRQRIDATAARKESGKLHDKLFVRHWDTWADGRRSQLFRYALDPDGIVAGPAGWLTKGIDGDVPTKPFGDLSEVAFSADGRSLVFTARIAGLGEAWSTNTDLYRVALPASGAPVNLTDGMAGYDANPVFSADGRFLYWTSMARGGYESDRRRIMERNLATGATREVAPGWDRSPDMLALASDGRTLYTFADDLGQRKAFAIDTRSGAVRPLTTAGAVGGFALGKDRLVAVMDDLDSPADLWSVPLRGGEPVRLTRHNAARLADVEFGAYEQFNFAGAGGDTVYGWVVKPTGFQAGKRYPVVLIVHGGPQGSMGNLFHYRWNPQTYAGKGYAAVFIDFHGSTGYGQAFTDAIRGDWGGKPLEDLQKGWAAAAARYPFLDTSRACALGASYGGYMMNWIAGSWNDGFRCIVNHAGIFDSRFMSYSTEELFFDEWEHEGTAYDRPENYEKQNPVNLVAKWRTPTLVSHGMQDFRVPFEQGLAAFTALQRRGIPSEFLWFPDENHWILKPRNSVQWHRAVESWLARWTGPEAPAK